MVEVEDANRRLWNLMGQLNSWVPEDAMREVVATWHRGDPAVTFVCLCDWLNAEGVVVARKHYSALAALGTALMFPPDTWSRVPVYLPGS